MVDDEPDNRFFFSSKRRDSVKVLDTDPRMFKFSIVVQSGCCSFQVAHNKAQV